MAQFNAFSLFIIAIFSSASLFSLASPRAISLQTQVLDVASAIQKTLHFLSPTFRDQKKSSNSSSSSSSFSLSVHPRSSLVRPHQRDYGDLMTARLGRDSVRVSSLDAKLRVAVSGLSRADFRPVQTAVRPEDLESPVTSGVSQGSGEYFARLGVGQPAKDFYMVIDTGSDVTWLQCEPCSDCYSQTDPIFNPAQSTSYRRLPCQAAQCSALEVSACGTDSCLYQVSYGDGSFTIGEFGTETVSFGKSGTVPNVAIGCGHDNEGLFVGAAGLIALGGGTMSLPSQIKATSFSYCLVDRDSGSSSTLEFNSARPGDSVLAPLLRNSKIDTFFYVGLTGISVGGDMLSIPPSVFQLDGSGNGGIIVDSGTAVTRLQSQAYNTLRDTFKKYTKNLPASGDFAIFDTCYDLSSMTKVSVPTIGFHFSGEKTLMLHPKNYLIPVDSAGKFCLAFAPTSGSLSIIGNIQQQGTRVSYDLANKLVGFSPDKC
ncbi:protein ASPARTIC PROTEASE IN GUARD CELL 1-like [Ipomoea triloba]|uniref:protein ASPARTIC PROTEASE IN GUARD CELL 1-like n=1 Tax=Ipomoea triloba TaxID=35885 RepID=UPI00125D659E|nr:protein ASPARTIC PROTEASE IN GUARD CELL 1-like [Ipomoea triloba]